MNFAKFKKSMLKLLYFDSDYNTEEEIEEYVQDTYITYKENITSEAEDFFKKMTVNDWIKWNFEDFSEKENTLWLK